MLIGKTIIGKNVVNLDYGRIIGQVKDLYLNEDLTELVGLNLGSTGLFSRDSYIVPIEEVTLLGEDIVLVKEETSKKIRKDVAGTGGWISRDEIQGRTIDSEGGTPIGTVDDIAIKEKGEYSVLGFVLGKIYLDGPVFENNSIARHAVLDTGEQDGKMIVNLKLAEYQVLQV